VHRLVAIVTAEMVRRSHREERWWVRARSDGLSSQPIPPAQKLAKLGQNAHHRSHEEVAHNQVGGHNRGRIAEEEVGAPKAPGTVGTSETMAMGCPMPPRPGSAGSCAPRPPG
jgi:hypothetical protein